MNIEIYVLILVVVLVALAILVKRWERREASKEQGR